MVRELSRWSLQYGVFLRLDAENNSCTLFVNISARTRERVNFIFTLYIRV